MYEYMNIKNKPIAIILIRSGSRGIHNKNIRPLAGKPLVFYTLEVAFASGLFSQIWVSSDSLTYLDICKKFYPDVKCILRAKKLALSTTSTLETLQDFLKPFDDNQIFFNLQVTSPLRVVSHLIEAYKLYLHSGADHLISCAKADKSRSLYLQMHDHYFIQQPKINKYYTRQKEPVYYYPNGSIWISRKNLYLRDESFYTNRTVVYEMPKLYSYDIDDELDFEIVEQLLQHHRFKENFK